MFFGLAKVNPVGETDLWTWWTYWQAYRDDPAVAKRLLVAAGIAFVVVFGGLGAAIIGAMRDRRALYGEARFASPAEVSRAGLFGEDGIIIGRWRNRFLTFGGMQFVLLAAPTRSGKGVGIVIPNLLAWGQSVVVLDVKQENFLVTSGYRARHGQECYLFNPFDLKGTTHRYNPLGYVSDNPRHQVTELLAIATALYPAAGKDSFFDEAARNLFLGIGLMVFETKGLPRTIGEMLRQSSGKGMPVKDYLQGIVNARNFREHLDVMLIDVGDDDEAVIDVLRDELGIDRHDAEMFIEDVPAANRKKKPVVVAKELKKDVALALIEALEAAGAETNSATKLLPVQEWDGVGDPPLTSACLDALSRFLGTSDNTLSSIMASFNVPLTLWASPIFDAATSANDFDLRDVRKRRMSIYLGIPANKLAEAELILNLFFTQLINLNTEDLLGAKPDLKYQCLLLMDEFAAPGRIAIIDKSNAYMAGYGMRLLTIIQSPGQLEAEPRKGYGRESARTLITNHACQILFTPREQRDADEYSAMLGTYTFRATSRSRQLAGRAGSSESISDQRRPLMLPQELKEMSQRQQIINLENTKPIICKKIAYYEDEVFLDRLREVAPSLASPRRFFGLIAPRKPSRSQLETAWGAGELASHVPTLDFDLHQAQTERRTREATAADVAAGVDLSRLAIDLSKVTAVPAGAAPADVTSTVNEFFDTLFATNGIESAPEEEDEDEDLDGAVAPDAPAEPVDGETAEVQAEASAEDDEVPAEAISEPSEPQSTASPLSIDLDELYVAEADDDAPEYIPDFLDDEPEYSEVDFDQDGNTSHVLDLSILDRPKITAGH
ncbi:type IV secretory system conjugative DNA transfer family protein [Aminobacter sp. MSH1]|uniref:type IV secretory system conjugative DNA transfer family protein n=1 Tax=Aminobacter sp. MSH1 TaxID=374606 RepID=UPI001FE0512C|nr:type IV secretory system conjugative DNA transfer family protein [Aminobacter sp. MSH1]